MNLRLARHSLLRQRSQLLARYRDELDRVDEQLDSRETEDVERATEQWDTSVLARLGDSDARALAEIVAAIRRLDAGTYGTCVSCEGPITSARLEAMPSAARCVACEAQEHPTSGAKLRRVG